MILIYSKNNNNIFLRYSRYSEVKIQQPQKTHNNNIIKIKI